MVSWDSGLLRYELDNSQTPKVIIFHFLQLTLLGPPPPLPQIEAIIEPRSGFPFMFQGEWLCGMTQGLKMASQASHQLAPLLSFPLTGGLDWLRGGFPFTLYNWFKPPVDRHQGGKPHLPSRATASSLQTANPNDQFYWGT